MGVFRESKPYSMSIVDPAAHTPRERRRLPDQTGYSGTLQTFPNLGQAFSPASEQRWTPKKKPGRAVSKLVSLDDYNLEIYLEAKPGLGS